jgi:hypothetical protein
MGGVRYGGFGFLARVPAPWKGDYWRDDRAMSDIYMNAKESLGVLLWLCSPA